MLLINMHSAAIERLQAFSEFLDTEYTALCNNDIATVLSLSHDKNEHVGFMHETLSTLAQQPPQKDHHDYAIVDVLKDVRAKVERNQRKYRALFLYTRMRKKVIAELLQITFPDPTYNAGGLEANKIIIHEPSLRFGQNA